MWTLIPVHSTLFTLLNIRDPTKLLSRSSGSLTGHTCFNCFMVYFALSSDIVMTMKTKRHTQPIDCFLDKNFSFVVQLKQVWPVRVGYSGWNITTLNHDYSITLGQACLFSEKTRNKENSYCSHTRVFIPCIAVKVFSMRSTKAWISYVRYVVRHILLNFVRHEEKPMYNRDGYFCSVTNVEKSEQWAGDRLGNAINYCKLFRRSSITINRATAGERL